MKDKNALKKQLTPLQYRVCFEKGTEAPFSGEYVHLKEDGTYHCICCDAELFRSDDKYDSGSGWPSYTQPFTKEAVKEIEDTSLGIKRIEVVCNQCGAHLGHVFPDGPQSTGLRYCINSASLKFNSEGHDE